MNFTSKFLPVGVGRSSGGCPYSVPAVTPSGVAEIDRSD